MNDECLICGAPLEYLQEEIAVLDADPELNCIAYTA